MGYIISEYELKTIQKFYGGDLIGYKLVGKGKWKRILTYSSGNKNEEQKVICDITTWGYPNTFGHRNILTILGGTCGEVPGDITKI